MDLSKIFIKDACPTKVGGQAVLEGVMMKGDERTSVCVRLPNGDLYIKTEKNKKRNRIYSLPFIRGVFVFVASLVQGMKTLMFSADVMEGYDGEGAVEFEEDKVSLWLEKKFGAQGAWNVMIYFSVFLSIIFTVLVFIIAPTLVVNLAKHVTENAVVLNLIEGVLRIVIFIAYIALIAKMEDIKRVFQYHGAEHKTIHCYENGLEMTPQNAKGFYTLHPRCGTSFLMFVMIIALALFSLLGWPSLLWRIVSRVLLLPVIAGLSYELLRWAGSSDSALVKVLSMPGLWLQKITTNEPDEEQLEVAICAMQAVVAEEGDYGMGICDRNGRILKHIDYTNREEDREKAEEDEDERN